MPSERSSASAITGLKALRTNTRSISLQTCIRPFCRTESVIGSTSIGWIIGVAGVFGSSRRIVQAQSFGSVAQPRLIRLQRGRARLPQGVDTLGPQQRDQLEKHLGGH